MKKKICLQCGGDISTEKYCSTTCQHEHKYQLWKLEVETSGKFSATIQPRRRHRRYLFEKQGGKCAICGRRTWLNKPIPLAFDHINGRHLDWRVENCRLICNNCDAQQPTYKGANRGRGREYRRCSSVGRAVVL